MKYITLDWTDYMADEEYWQKVSKEKSIPLHLGVEMKTLQETLRDELGDEDDGRK